MRFFTSLYALVWLIGCQDTADTGANHPNIVLILTDDQGWGDLSSNGNQDLETPNIDRLAVEGATFERFYVCPVCSPTRAELLTGRYHVRCGVYSTSAGGERIDLDEKLLPQYLQEAGYRTGAFGKWHSGMQPPYHPNARGFDEFYGFCSGHWGDYFSPMLEHNGAIVKGEGFLTDDLTTKAMQFVEDHQDHPFFVYLPLQTPHSPMQVPDDLWAKFADKDLKMSHPDSSADAILHTRAALALCENIDYNVGRLVQKIEDLDLAEETIILYLSDNGPNGPRWNGEMRGRKGSTDEGGVRSPLIMRWSGTVTSGLKIESLGTAVDLLPTLLELVKVEAQPPKEIDGLDITSSFMTPNTYSQVDRIVVNHWRGRTSVRNGRFRLDNDGRLYDMIQDPSQILNVAESFPQELDLLQSHRVKFDEEVVAELPREDNRPFAVGAPDHKWTQLPARDAIVTGSIERSNRWPNDSFFENWTSTDDSIYWDVEVLEDGDFLATIYCTCRQEDVGCTIQLSSGSDAIVQSIDQAHDPKLEGASYDRFPRQESYTKAFKPVELGKIQLTKGKQRLALTADQAPGKGIVDFRLLMLERT